MRRRLINPDWRGYYYGVPDELTREGRGLGFSPLPPVADPDLCSPASDPPCYGVDVNCPKCEEQASSPLLWFGLGLLAGSLLGGAKR